MKLTCPLGSTCRKTDDEGNDLERCRWYIEVKGTDAQGSEVDRWDCAISFMPIMQLETAQNVRGTNQSVQSLRNEQVLGHQQFMKLVHERSQ